MSIIYPLPKTVSDHEWDLWYDSQLNIFSIMIDGFTLEIEYKYRSRYNVIWEICIYPPNNPFTRKIWFMPDITTLAKREDGIWKGEASSFGKNCRFPNIPKKFWSVNFREKADDYQKHYIDQLVFSNSFPSRKFNILFYLCMNRLKINLPLEMFLHIFSFLRGFEKMEL
jgi:hypothetical protein